MSDQPITRKAVRIECAGAATQNTKVILDDGSVLEGIARIELVAMPNDVWRARIDLIPSALRIDAEGQIIGERSDGWDQCREYPDA